MRAKIFFLISFSSVVLLFLLSSSVCKDREEYVSENGSMAVVRLVERPAGNGELLEATFWTKGGPPIVFWDTGPKTGGVTIKPSSPEQIVAKVISVAFPGKKLYDEGIEISIRGGIIQKVDVEVLPDHAKIVVRGKTLRSVNLLVTGHGEIVNYCLAYIWVQPIVGQSLQYWYSPTWASMTMDNASVWKIPIGISTTTPIKEAGARINNLPTDTKFLWWEPGDFFPMAHPEGPDDQGNLLVQNVTLEFFGPDGNPMAPPTKKALTAILASRGYVQEGDKIYKNGQLVWRTIGIPITPIGTDKKVATWGFMKKQ